MTFASGCLYVEEINLKERSFHPNLCVQEIHVFERKEKQEAVER